MSIEISNEPATVNIKARQGATLRLSVEIREFDPTGFGARMQVRKTPSSPEKIIDISTEEGSISLSVDEHTSTSARLVATVSFGVMDSVSPGSYVYDLELYSSSVVVPFFKGKFSVSAQVTR